MNQTASVFSETRLFGTVSTEGNYSIENVSHLNIMDTNCCTLASFTWNCSFHYNRNSRWW